MIGCGPDATPHCGRNYETMSVYFVARDDLEPLYNNILLLEEMQKVVPDDERLAFLEEELFVMNEIRQA